MSEEIRLVISFTGMDVVYIMAIYAFLFRYKDFKDFVKWVFK